MASFWLGSEERPPARPGDAKAALAAFEKERVPDQEIDLAPMYGGRLELLDPRRTLPTWHKHLPSDAIATRNAARDCSEPSVFVADPELAKAIDWHAASCAHSRTQLETLAERPPFLHPTGSSYAQLLRNESPAPDLAWLGLHKRAFHVLELRELPAQLLTAEERTLSELPAAAFARILDGDATVLTHAWIMHVSRDQHGPAKLALRARDRWDTFAENAGVALVDRSTSGACAEPASSVLCWRTLPLPPSRRTTARALGAGGAVLLAAAIAFSIALVVRARREAERERVFLMRALTHELRSPVTAMRLDVEPLRAAFDALPEDCQEPMLRLSAGIERLSRVLEVTGRALSLFDSRRENAAIVARVIPSVHAYFEELRDEWPEDVTLDVAEEDHAFVTDPDWLRVAVKNLVENAAKHGEGRVRVHVRVAPRGGELVVRVSDEGKTPELSLATVTRPFAKGERSSGLGLGLSLVRRIVERQGGRLRHEPDPTTFELRMPEGKDR